LVRAALRAAADRSDAVRRRADFFACELSALFDAAERPFLFNLLVEARLRFADGLRRGRSPFSRSLFAFSRVSSDASPFSGGGRSTPARRALESPIAIACSGELAPCFPSRM
jgi:hypothetical protein